MTSEAAVSIQKKRSMLHKTASLMCMLLALNILLASATMAGAILDDIRNDAGPSCQTIIMIDNVIGEVEVEYGNYIYLNGTQSSAKHYITDKAQAWIDERQLFCTVISSIVTDDAPAMRAQIEAWIWHECRRLDLGGNCLVKDMTGHYNTKLYVLPDSARFTAMGADHKTKKIILSTNSPTPTPTTSSPTVPSECQLRSTDRDCHQDSACNWFGATIGCQRVSYCGFKTSTACLSRWRYCEWRGGKCRSKND